MFFSTARHPFSACHSFLSLLYICGESEEEKDFLLRLQEIPTDMKTLLLTIYDRFSYNRLITIVLLCLLLPLAGGQAQLSERVYQTDYRIDPEKKGELRVELDNISFFRDNEYAGSVMDGYSLPGFWVQPKAVYYPLKNIKLEAGLHLLYYWGATKYPNMAYQDIAVWKGEQYQHKLHILPFFRAQFALSKHVDIVLGDIYGGSNHRLIEPLYTPELNLTADPEAGLQLLYSSKPIDLDVWVDWQSFIFREDVHQEAFIVGLSTRFKLNAPESRFHFYVPLQGVVQHRGGEIDTIYTQSVQTLMNGAVGLGGVWNTGHRLWKRVNVEVDGTGYYQQAGQLWPFDPGAGIYAKASADIYDFRIKTSYFAAHNFISLLGLPFYGAVSTKQEGMTFRNPQLVYFGVEYAKQLGKGYALGIDLDVYHRLAGQTMHPEKGTYRESGSTSFAFGIYFRINPSFLIKKLG